VDPDPEEEPGAQNSICDVAGKDAGGAGDEVCSAEPRKQRRQQDCNADEVQDAEDDVDGREEDPGDGGDDEAVTEDREAAPDVLERKITPGEARSISQ
jgi:hypothetical protein